MKDFVPMLIVVAILVLPVIATALLAARKGYHWYLWFLTTLPGLVVLAFLPFANKPDVSEEVNRQRKKTGNIIGAVITGILFVWVILSKMLR